MIQPTKIVFTALTLLLFSTCSEKDIQTHSEDDFQDVITLREERKMTREVLSVRGFLVKDSLLITSNSRDDSIFMAFDISGRDTLECIKTWGTKGKGPDEYGTFNHLIDLPRNEFYLADFSRMKFRKFNVPAFDVLEKKKIVNNRTQPQFSEIPQTIVTPDGSQFFYDKFKMHELYITRWKNGADPEEIYDFPGFREKYKKQSAMTYFGSMAINRKLERMVYAYKYFRRFDLLDFKGNLIKKVEITPAPPLPVFKNDGKNPDLENSVLCFMQARATDQSIYLYYVGKSYKDIMKNNYLIHSWIEEYDWKGNPVNRYKLNRFISDFHILSEEENSVTFIATDDTHEHPFIILK